MDMPAGLEALNERIGTINDVLNAASVLTWDSRTMMPAGGAETRGRQIATLTRLGRDLLLDGDTSRALDAAEGAVHGLAEDAAARRMVDKVRHAVEHHRRIPASLIEERAALRTPSQSAWAEARGKSDFTIFLPYLEKTIALTRAYADCVGWSGHRYDAMISLYEPGETTASLRELFGGLRAGLKPVLEAALAKAAPPPEFLSRDFPEEGQRAFAHRLAEGLGYDFNRGRLDPTVHPFEVSFTRNDVRITTRYNRNYLPASIFGTAHETGHGLYEQGVDPAYTRTALTTDLIGLYGVGGTSFGAHESQSRLWENHVVRSRRFWALHFGALKDTFPDALGDVDAQDFYRAVTRVEPGFIRVEADELTYDFHIMLRVEIEAALMDGSLEAADLPEAWNGAISRDLGLKVPDDRRGVLQDVHWSSGSIGSFCTYSIGNIMAAQLMETLRQKDGQLDGAVAAGDYGRLAAALKEAVWRHGRRFGRDELLRRETGRSLDTAPYLAYLKEKYAG